MATWLLAWNAGKWEWHEYDEFCEKASKENPVGFRWSCNSTKVKIGDEFYLTKVGDLPRGIFAHGTITKGIFEDEQWDKDRAGEMTNYIEVASDRMLNYKTQDILDVSILDERCAQQWWHPMKSGIQINDEVLPKLEELWAEVTGDSFRKSSIKFKKKKMMMMME